MKIAVWHNLPSGGSSRALHEQLKGLYQRGHQIELWTNPMADLAYLNVNDFVTKIHSIPLTHQTNRISIKDRIGAVFFETDNNIKVMQAHCKICAEQIDEGGFDVLFANTCYYYAVPFISRFVKIPKLLYLGEPNRHLYEATSNFRWEAPVAASPKWFRRSYWRMFFIDFWQERADRVKVREERRNYEAFDKVLVNSFYSAESCIKAYGTPPQVCYLGISTQVFKNLSLKREPFVMGIGNFYPNKNPEFAIRSIAQIPAEIRPKLIWVANMSLANYLEKCKKLAVELSVNLVLREMITDIELVELLNKASVFIYTSKLEPFGLAPLEANACGLPVVAIAEAGVRETVIHQYNGLLVPNNHQEMANGVVELISNENLWNELSANSISHIETNWSVQKSIDRIEEALQTTIK